MSKRHPKITKPRQGGTSANANTDTTFFPPGHEHAQTHTRTRTGEQNNTSTNISVAES